LGDAAHALIPTGGLGASLALEDAECLTKCLSQASPKDFDINGFKKTLDAWEQHRKVRLALVQEFTDRNRRLRQAGGSWLTQTVKEWVVWTLFKFVGGGGMAEKIYGYDTKQFEEILGGL
jgi:2-polyprenyl-6-methoxyphenol hydroxylase-like FAD-dependent oxidoreductase